MRNFSLLLAIRFARSLPDESAVSHLTKVAIGSIILIATAITVGIALLQGFQAITISLLRTIHCDMIIESAQQKPLAYEKIHQTLVSEFSSLVVADTPYAELYVIAQGKDTNDLSHAALLQAIDPRRDSHVRNLVTFIKKPSPPPEPFLTDKGILIGRILANELGVTIGDSITLIFATGRTKKTIASFQEKKVKITGICATGLEEHDAMLLFCSHNFFKTINPHASITSVGIKLQSGFSEKTIKQKLQDRFNLKVLSWQDLYPTLATALRLERLAVLSILFLIALMAAITVIAFMLFYLLYKTKTIAILLATGIPLHIIRRSFLLLGTGLTFVTSGIGILIGACVSTLIDRFHLIPLPETYGTTYLPAHLCWQPLAATLIFITFLGFLGSWWATRSLKNLPLASALKVD
ncbi:MAG: ABC transporter permease [Candidatus Babeliaceae bacterium]|nr:ABC transporter permease [Candidatus Babeliaceae bacterium]